MTDKRSSIIGLVVLVLAVGAATQWWAGRSQAQLGEKLSSLARPGDIQMLSSTTCAYCSVARQWMRQHEVAFDECFIETDAACAARFEALRAPGTPVLLVRGQLQTGFDAQRVLGALSRGAPAS
ncbi:MAG: glutaredoxin family protein [Burkholderiaceae bacterium]|jgi:glutaredoxin|nr:glutaredoxin family protein [Burkholderiaceae bacterium]